MKAMSILAAASVAAAISSSSLAQAQELDLIGGSFAMLGISEADSCVDNIIRPLISNWISNDVTYVGEEQFVGIRVMTDALTSCEGQYGPATDYRRSDLSEGFTVYFSGMATSRVGMVDFKAPVKSGYHKSMQVMLDKAPALSPEETPLQPGIVAAVSYTPV